MSADEKAWLRFLAPLQQGYGWDEPFHVSDRIWGERCGTKLPAAPLGTLTIQGADRDRLRLLFPAWFYDA